MHRLLVALLAALDAVIAAAVGVAAALAPLTLLWVFGLGAPMWGALWPASAAVWQFGHFVPLSIELPAAYLAASGIPVQASSFVLSLAPLAFACFTAWFAARSGRRAAIAGAWGTGVLSGGLVFAVIAAGVWLTARTPIAAVHGWQAVLFPVLVFVVPAVAGAVATAWRQGDGGLVDRVHDRVDALPGGWRQVPELAVRGAAIVLVGLVGLGGLALAVAFLLRGGQAVALFEAGHLDAIGVVVVSLAQFAYLPTLVVWAASFVAGPGFAFGAGTAVSPAGTQLGVIPGIPVLGVLPESTAPWLLAIVILPVAVAAFAGWTVRSRLATSGERESVGVQLALTAAIALLSALGAALLAVVASGAAGPDRLAQTGPEPGPLALALGVEVLVGAGILLLAPRREGDVVELPETDAATPAVAPMPVWPPVGRVALGEPDDDARPERDIAGEDETETAPIDPGFLGGPAEPDTDRNDRPPSVD